MSSENEGKGCAILVVLSVIVLGIGRTVKWIMDNKETVNNGIEVAKRKGIWVLVALVLLFVFKRILAYRKAIRNSETNYLSVVLRNHNFEDLMQRAKSLSDNAREVLPEIEKSQLELEQGMRELRNKGQ